VDNNTIYTFIKISYEMNYLSCCKKKLVTQNTVNNSVTIVRNWKIEILSTGMMTLKSWSDLDL